MGRSPGDIADPKALRQAFGAFATGVTVVTVGGVAPHGMTANSFTTVSLKPPLVLVCVDRDAVMHRLLPAAGKFAVSVLSAGQQAIAKHFSDRRRPLGAEQFKAVRWRRGPTTGAPLILGAAAVFECELWSSHNGGDHSIFVGALASFERRADDGALLFVHGRFERLPTHSIEVAR